MKFSYLKNPGGSRVRGTLAFNRLWTLSLLMLLISQLSVGKALAQSITLHEKNSSLEAVLHKISEQAEADLIGDISLLRKSKPVQIEVSNKDIHAVLAMLESGQNVQLLYSNKTIVIKAKKAGDSNAHISNFKAPEKLQQHHLSGKVTNEKGEILAGVSIQDLSSKKMIGVSNKDGSFDVICAANSNLVFSLIGYEPKIEEINKRTQIRVTLKAKENVIEETVVTGYSTLRKENFTGAATTITRKELEKFNNNNIFSIIQSLDPSFKVDEGIQDGSNPNVIPEINIRGVASVGQYAVNAPLVIMDGFETTLETLYDMDVNRIESISILKDASSTSMYGSRGGNGVIVIETRLPKEGKFTITYDARPSITLVDLSDYNLMNAKEKLEYEFKSGQYDAFADGLSNNSQTHILQEGLNNLYADRLENVNAGVNTYWLKIPVQSTLSVNHSLRMEGGYNDVRYSIDANYFDMKGAMKESGRKRLGTGFGLIYRIPGKLLFSNKANFLYSLGYNSPYGEFSTYALLNPYERIRNEKGELNVVFNEFQDFSFGASIINPLYDASLPTRNQKSEMLISNNVMLEWNPINSLKITGKGYIGRKILENEKFLSPFHTKYRLVNNIAQRGEYGVQNGKEFQYDGNVNVQYSKDIKKHQFIGNLLAEIKSIDFLNVSYNMTGFSDDKLISPSASVGFTAGSRPTVVSSPANSLGFMGALFYTYDNKINYSFTYRLDGSSLFGSENRFGGFWSTGASYNMHKEPWFQNSIVNKLRMFGNIGINGNEGFMANMVSTAYRIESGGFYYNQFGYTYLSQGNATLTWPQIKQLSLGVDLSLFNDMISLSGSYYDKNTHNMISMITVAPSFGFKNNSFYQNLGMVNNRGFELKTVVKVLENPENRMVWNVNLGLVKNRGILKEISEELRKLNESTLKKDQFDNIVSPSVYYEEGASLTSIRAMPSLGIDPATGKELFLDRNGNKTFAWDASNMRIMGNQEPDFFGVFGSSLMYKGFSAQALFNYSIGGDLYNITLREKIENNNPSLNADRRVLYDRWQEPGEVKSFKSIADKEITQLSSRFIQRENYIRLSSLNLNYELPIDWIRKYKFQRVKVNFSANDVLRINTVKMERGINYPYALTYNFGLLIQL